METVSIRPTQVVKNLIRKTGMISLTTSRGPDRAQSQEKEMITAEQKIGEKVFAHGSPTKFPVPDCSRLHMIITDMRGYLDEGGAKFDYCQMAYGACGIPPPYSWMIHYWEVKGKIEPIKGLFEKDNQLRAAPYVQERIHFLGFVRENEYRQGEIPEIAYYFANPELFPSETEARSAFESFPLAR